MTVLKQDGDASVRPLDSTARAVGAASERRTRARNKAERKARPVSRSWGSTPCETGAFDVQEARQPAASDYRIKGRDRLKTMTLAAHEFVRRFLLHVLPSGFHRIRHYGLFAGAVRADNIERVRQLLAPSKVSPDSAPADPDGDAEPASSFRRCPCCGGRMIVVETFEGPRPARSPPPSRIRIDTS